MRIFFRKFSGTNDGNSKVGLLGAPALRVHLGLQVVAEQGAAPRLCGADLIGGQSRGSAKVRAFQAGAVEICTTQHGAEELRSAEIRALEVRVNEDRIPELSAAQVRTL